MRVWTTSGMGAQEVEGRYFLPYKGDGMRGIKMGYAKLPMIHVRFSLFLRLCSTCRHKHQSMPFF